MRAIYLDCFSGISGNMLLGAFLDGGVPEAHLREELGKLRLADEFSLQVRKVCKRGVRAAYVDVILPHGGGAAHHAADHGHRNLTDILAVIDAGGFSEVVRRTSRAVFTRLAEAEAKVHGTTVAAVHFHEVGAVDSIVDIVGAAICLDYLGVEKVYAARPNVGGGFVKCAHGVMPVPAPATAELLQGVSFYAKHAEKELVTPTGAALLAVLAEFCPDGPPEGFRYERIAYGAGTWDLEIPNVLRVYLGEAEAAAGETEKKNC